MVLAVNDFINLSSNMSFTPPYGVMDCSYIKTQMCNSLNNNIDNALIIMAIGLILQMSRKWLSRLALKVPQIAPIANYLDTSILPELFIDVGFLFIAFIRFGGA